MKPASEKEQSKALQEALDLLREATAAQKCRACGCFHNLLDTIRRAFSKEQLPTELSEVVDTAQKLLLAVSYPCLGCEVCYPALVTDALSRIAGEELLDFEVCPGDKVEERQGWPPLPGAYTVLRYRAPVAVCALMEADLALAIARQAGPEIAIAGMLQTENLGIERLIQNISANPYLRFLVVCGVDSPQAVGHWPGQSLLALVREGVDAHGRIINARGRRPRLRNISREAVDHFRRTVEVIDLLGTTEIARIIAVAREYAARDPGPSQGFPWRALQPVQGYLPPRMVADPAGYFVVYVDRARGTLSLEHYRNDGLLDAVIEGASAAELYTPAITQGLLSRLDHAAYLGRELAKAENSLSSGAPYIQDAAPEAGRTRPLIQTASVGKCSPTCREAEA